MGAFTDQLKRFAEKAGADMETLVRRTTSQLMDGVVTRSPVDTGRFRGNWMVGIGSPVRLVVAATDKTGDASRQRVDPAINTWKPGMSIFITSHLPYAMRLEYGWSKQAAGGMVRLTVQDFKDYVSRAAQEAK